MLSQKEKNILLAVEKRQGFLLFASIACAVVAFAWLLCGFYYYHDYAIKLRQKVDWVDSVAPRTRTEAELKATSKALLSVFTRHSGKISALWVGLVFCSFSAFSLFLFGLYYDRKAFLGMIGKIQEEAPKT
jgi:hypothetical protein